MVDNYRLLLERAARLYDTYGVGRREPFNVFTALHSANDEVNLHSRFLHALLKYRKPGHETRENLADFLQHVGVGNFEQRGVKVEREQSYIDILITNDDRQAIVIENKISAVDQSEQLQRYHDAVKKQGYDKIHLLYLTLHGYDPSEISAGGLPYKTISYRDTLPPWLERCQQRAYDEPGLRESVAQYRQLVSELTGTDFGGSYMSVYDKELKELCLEGRNLVLVHDLNKAMIEAQVDLLQKLYCEIDAELREKIPDLPERNERESDVSHKTIKNFVSAGSHFRDTVRLFYSFRRSAARQSAKAHLVVGTDGKLYFGVRCSNNGLRQSLQRTLNRIGNAQPEEKWPWRKYHGEVNLKNPNPKDLELLSNDESRQKYAEGIARDLKPVWEAIKAAGLCYQGEATLEVQA